MFFVMKDSKCQNGKKKNTLKFSLESGKCVYLSFFFFFCLPLRGPEIAPWRHLLISDVYFVFFVHSDIIPIESAGSLRSLHPGGGGLQILLSLLGICEEQRKVINNNLFCEPGHTCWAGLWCVDCEFSGKDKPWDLRSPWMLLVGAMLGVVVLQTTMKLLLVLNSIHFSSMNEVSSYTNNYVFFVFIYIMFTYYTDFFILYISTSLLLKLTLILNL